MGRIKDAIKILCGDSLPTKKEMYAIPKMIGCDKKLCGKVSLIIGATGGIGKAIAEAFIRNGSKVILAARNENKLNALRLELVKKYGNVCKSYVIDICSLESIRKAVANIPSLFDDNIIDILVNAGGVNTQTAFWDIDEYEYERIMDTNLKGTFFACQCIADYMRRSKIKGHILNISSASSLRPAWTPYEISKWGINGFTRGLADLCLQYGIIVNAIAPGPVATEMLNKKETDNIFNENTVAGRYAMPSEIADLAVFMVSEFGDLIVGDTFYITGGSGIITLHK